MTAWTKGKTLSKLFNMAHNEVFHPLLFSDHSSDTDVLRKVIDQINQTPHFDIQMQLAVSTDFSEVQTIVDADETELLIMGLPSAPEKALEFLQHVSLFAEDVPVIVLVDEQSISVAKGLMKHQVQDYLVRTHLSAELLARSVRYAVNRFVLQIKLELNTIFEEFTGLYNETGLIHLGNLLLDFARRNEFGLTVLFGDIASFSQFNAKNGQAAGDEVLSRLTDILRRCFPDADVLARPGGDEFAIVTTETLEIDHDMLQERVGEHLQTFNAELNNLPYTVSVDFVLTYVPPEEVVTMEELLGRVRYQIGEYQDE